MEVLERLYGRITGSDLILDPNEVALRLEASRGYTNALIDKCTSLLYEKVDCRYVAVRVRVEITGDRVTFGGIKAQSESLARNLGCCKECFVMAVTLGGSVDYMLKRLAVTSLSEHYITDALASALAESAADSAENIITNGRMTVPRFSAGYGDLSIETQPEILELLMANKYLGIALSRSYLMTPQKSITAIIGIKTE